MEIQKIAEYGAAGISIIAIYAIYWIVCKFLNFLKDSEERHCKTYERLDETLRKNTEVVEETRNFMVGLNGKLKKAYDDKINK